MIHESSLAVQFWLVCLSSQHPFNNHKMNAMEIVRGVFDNSWMLSPILGAHTDMEVNPLVPSIGALMLCQGILEEN